MKELKMEVKSAWYLSLASFTIDHNLQKEAEMFFGENWAEEADEEVSNLLEYMGLPYYEVVYKDDDGHFVAEYNKDWAKIAELEYKLQMIKEILDDKIL